MAALNKQIRRLRRKLRRLQRERVQAGIINRHGGHRGWLVVREARRAKLALPIACTLLEKESNFLNVFGNDAVANPVRGGKVTRARYRRYLSYRRRGMGAQGVGPAQLTWPPTQDMADSAGGCWKYKYNIRVGFRLLRDLVVNRGTHDGARAYNGSGPAAEAYADDFVVRKERWERRLRR